MFSKSSVLGHTYIKFCRVRYPLGLLLIQVCIPEQVADCLNHASLHFVIGWLNSAHSLPILHPLTVELEGWLDFLSSLCFLGNLFISLKSSPAASEELPQ